MGLAARSDDTVIVWQPQPGPQTSLLTCPVFEVFYGGARGGGKTQGMLGDFAAHAGEFGANANGLMVRRTRVELEDTIEKSKAIYGPIGATWHEQGKYWRFPDGAKLTFAYLERDADAQGYQGHGYTRVYVEEIGNFPDPAPIKKLMATLRSGAGVPVGFRATGNPGGPGHQWVKGRYIDPAPGGYKILRDEESGLERVFIPAKVSDNLILMENDPGYVSRLKASGSPALVKAWLEGDWSVVEGAYFPEFSTARHVVRPHVIPDTWLRFRCGDWGSAAPFAFYWVAVVGDGDLYPRGALVVYREWYGCSEPNVGLKLDAAEVARQGAPKDYDDKIQYGVLDPSAFKEDGGPSIAERMVKAGWKTWQRADNQRIPGWDQVRARLVGDGDGRPMLYIFDTCTHLIRTLPALQHDEHKPEDVDTESEDHAGDALRYGCMSRPWVRKVPQPAVRPAVVIGGKSTLTLDQAWKISDRRRGSTGGRI